MEQRKLESLNLSSLRNLLDGFREKHDKIQIELWDEDTDEILRMEFTPKFILRYHPSEEVKL